MNIGVALSGGGIKGIAHAGAIKALEDNGIKIDVIGGTSSGSIVASLYAMGYVPNEIKDLFKKNAKSIVKIKRFPIIFNGIGNIFRTKKISLTGLNSGNYIEELYNDISLKNGIKTIGDIKMPLVITSVDLVTSKEYIFTNNIPKESDDKNRYITDVSIGKAVRASSSFSGVFSPCKYKMYNFVDGGALDSVPVIEVKRQGVDKVIAIKFAEDDINNESNIMDIAFKTIDIMGNKICENSLKKSDYIVNIKTDKVGFLDIEKIDKCFQAGYNAITENIDKIREKLK